MADHGPQWEEAYESLGGLLVLLRGTCGLGEQSECGKLHNGPQEVPSLIPGACDYVTFQGERGFAGVIKSQILQWGDYPGPSGWAQCHHKVLIRGRQE